MELRRLVAIALTVCITLSTIGCATAPNVSLTPAESKLRADKRRFDQTVIGGVVSGAAVGAVLGALLGAAGGGDRRDIARGAAIGAMAGGTLGALDGYRTATLQAAKMNQAEALNLMAGHIQADNQKLAEVVNSSSVVREEATRRLATLRADIEAKRKTSDQVAADRRREEANLQQMQAALTNAKKTRDDYQKVANSMSSGADSQRVGAQLQRMQQQINELERNIAQYSSAITASRA